MKTNITNELKWLGRIAGMALQTEGLRAGQQCLVCRCWKRPCEACLRSGTNGNGAIEPHRKRRPDLDERIREMLGRER